MFPDDDNQNPKANAPCGGFFQPDTHRADFTYWAKMRVWKETEAVSLFLGLNPNFIWHGGAVSHWAEQHEAEILGLLTLAVRATDDRDFGWPYTPSRWLAWANKNDLPMPSELKAKIIQYGRVAAPAELGTAVIEKNKDRRSTDEDIDTMIRGADAEFGRRVGVKLLWKIAKDKLNTSGRLKERANKLSRPDLKSSAGRPKKNCTK